jgi:hypothetical protein
MNRRLRIPATLALTALGLGAPACSPSPAGDSGPGDGGSDAASDTVPDAPGDGVPATCQNACEAVFSVPSTMCMPGTVTDGALGCNMTGDAASPGICEIAARVTASTGPCCCEPLI